MQSFQNTMSMNIMAPTTGETNLFFSLIVLPLSLLCIIIIFFFQRSSSKANPPLPPGPYPWPIVGNIFQLAKNTPLNVTLAKLAQTHGPLMLLKIGAQPLIVGSSPAAAREILKTHDSILSGRYVSHPLRVKGSKVRNLALVFSDECDDQWKRIRSVYKGEFFSAKTLDSQVEMREKKVMEMVKYLGSKEGQVVKIKETVFFTALNILSNAIVSRDFVEFQDNGPKGIGEEMMQNIRRFGEMGSIPQLADMYPKILGGWDFQSMYKKWMVIRGKVCAVWIDIVKERRHPRKRNDLSVQRDFTDALIEFGFEDEQINAMLTELFGAGTESTTATNEWALTELMRNQAAMQKLRDELAKEVSGDIVRESNLPHLPYLQACIKETLRLHPPGPLLLPHRAVRTCQVMGYTIPKDSQVMVNMWAIARDPTIWDDPLSFKPERFLLSGLDYKGIDFEYIPFGSGRHFCTGQPLASRVVPLILGSLIHNFDWVLPGNMDPDEIDMNEMLDVTMLKKEPLCAIPKLRRPFKN